MDILRSKKAVLAVTALFALSGCTVSSWTRSAKFVNDKGDIIHNARDIVIEKPEARLPQTQKLTFNAQWLGIGVGQIVMEIKGIKKINGRDAYCLEASFKSNAFLSAIYRIDDRYVSYMDVEKLHTLRHEVVRHDGDFHKNAVTDFDQENHKAHFKNFIDNSQKDFDIPPNVQDTLTACYYFMLMPLDTGDKIDYNVCNNESNYQLLGAVENKAFIRTPALGQTQAFLIRPYAKLKGKKIEKGVLRSYFSCDKRRIPLFTIIQGSIFTEVTAILAKVE